MQGNGLPFLNLIKNEWIGRNATSYQQLDLCHFRIHRAGNNRKNILQGKIKQNIPAR